MRLQATFHSWQHISLSHLIRDLTFEKHFFNDLFMTKVMYSLFKSVHKDMSKLFFSM